MFFDLVRWWLAVQLLALLALPLATWFFRRLPDRGYSVAKPFGLLLAGWGAWLLAMLGLGGLDAFKLIAVALLAAAAGVLLQGRAGLRQMIEQLRARWGWIVFQEALFVAALGGAIWLRWHGIWGYGVAIAHTEMPMDLAFLSGILASPQFPPQDPWLSQYPINYYYLGYLLVASLIRLSGVAVGVGYTLGIATIFAFTATNVAGVVRNLIELAEHRIQNTEQTDEEASEQAGQKSNRAHRPSLSRWLVPLVGVVFVLIAGNQAGALQLLAGSEKVVALEPTQLAQAVGNGIGTRQTLELPPPFPAGEFPDKAAQLTPADKAADFDVWWPSRAVWDTLDKPEGTVRRYAITEFPFFSFYLGDLHPHVLSLPWTLLALTLALNVLAQNRAPNFRSRGGWIELLLTAIILGGLYAINSWDLPTYLLLYFGALALLYAQLAGSPRRFFWAHFVQQAGLTLVASYIVYGLFHATFAAPTQGFPLGIAPARTGLIEFLVLFALFCVPLIGHVVLAGRAAQTDGDPAARAVWSLGPLPTLLALLAVLLVGVLVGWPLFALLPLALYALWLAYSLREQPATAFALLVFALGALVVWGTDLIYLRDNFEGYAPRMNTLFKFYYQVWLLWGTLAAFALWALLRRIRPATALWLAPWSLLLIGALVYPALAPSDAAPDRTLDGLAYVAKDRPAEAAAIEWVRANTAPDAVVLQAPGASYNAETSRIAAATGRPTLIGWPDSHEGLWRRGQPEVASQLGQRADDARLIYTSTDPNLVRSLLARYNVRYVYVGAQEQALVAEQSAPAEALTKFDQIMPRVFEQDGVIIYQMP